MTFCNCSSTDRTRAVRPTLGTSSIGRTSSRLFGAEAVIHTGYSCLEYWVPVICFVCHCSSQFSHCSALSFDVRFHYVIFRSVASARGNVNARMTTSDPPWYHLGVNSSVCSLKDRHIFGTSLVENPAVFWACLIFELRVPSSSKTMEWTSLENLTVYWTGLNIELRVLSSSKKIERTSSKTTIPTHSMSIFLPHLACCKFGVWNCLVVPLLAWVHSQAIGQILFPYPGNLVGNIRSIIIKPYQNSTNTLDPGSHFVILLERVRLVFIWQLFLIYLTNPCQEEQHWFFNIRSHSWRAGRAAAMDTIVTFTTPWCHFWRRSLVQLAEELLVRSCIEEHDRAIIRFDWSSILPPPTNSIKTTLPSIRPWHPPPRPASSCRCSLFFD